ncbi:glyoxalase, partial [Duganella sp. BJB1802]|nr:glyoxalase [Duganella sp. BJB1802]
MTQLAPNRSIQDVMVIPVLHYQDVAVAAQWLCEAFGFSER